MAYVLADWVNPYEGDYVRCPFCRQALKAEMDCLYISLKGRKMSVCPDCEQEFREKVNENRHTWDRRE